MIKAVIFDFDDTLVNTLETKTAALQYVAKTIYNYNLPTETIHTHWGKPYPEMLTEIFTESQDDPDSIIMHYEKIRKQFPSQLYKKVKETLHELSAKVTIGILTSAGKSVLVEDLNTVKLPIEMFEYIQTAEDTKVHKPNPKVFDPLLNKLNLLPSEVIYVGDSINDYLAAKKAGLVFYGISHDIDSKNHIFKENNVEVLKSLDDLKDLII